MPKFIQNLSVRVPWHDSGWNGHVCRSPRDNTECVLLENIGLNRDDVAEEADAGKSIVQIPGKPPPCISERGSFMSPDDIIISDKEHPYAWKNALSALDKAQIPVPAWSMHAVPYYWLAREHVEGILKNEPIPGYVPELEDEALKLVDFDPKRQTWVLHGENQKALIETFFKNVVPGKSLVFFYLKYSPFEHVGRILAGAALVDRLDLPGRWPASGETAFPNHMWETILRHTLREDGSGGLILPLQDLAELAKNGEDITPASALAPETDREFSYVTEHVPADTTVAALLALRNASKGAAELGFPVPAESLTWLDEQLFNAWERRGTTPGLPAVLAQFGIEHPTFTARAIIEAVEEGEDPWLILTMALEGNKIVPKDIASIATPTMQRIWKKLPLKTKDALGLMSRFNLTSKQVEQVVEQKTYIPIEPDELPENPYYLVTCTVDDDDPIRFNMIDRGCFPGSGKSPVQTLQLSEPLTDLVDRRRVEAAIVDELAAAEEEGHTLLTTDEILNRLSKRSLGRDLPLSEIVLSGLDLDPISLDDDPEINWPVLSRTIMASGEFAYKLRPSSARSSTIREFIELLSKKPRHNVPKELSDAINVVLGPLDDHDPGDLEAEKKARTEKKAALSELYSSRFSILNGPAGTGKTTLIKALAERQEVTTKGVLLLAPTGKARVQLSAKVGLEASTIAQYLSHSGRYDGEACRYRVTGNSADRKRYGLVVVDEASMLTEDMLAALCDSLILPDRLILVGDPRQLPPIGPGRPFVDLERAYRKGHHGGWPRVAPGWAELKILRRQKGRVRDDLMLAQWFSGDEIPEGFDEVWERLRRNEEMESLRAISWGGRTPEEMLDYVLAEELGVCEDDEGRSFAASYGATLGKYIEYFSAAEHCERWQALSPFRGRSYGTVQLNRHIKEKYRQGELQKAQLPPYKRKVPKPLGPERIVLGDKVVNLLNRGMTYWSRSEGNKYGYIANGELGVVIGQLKSKSMQTAPWKTQIEYSSQLGRRYGAKYASEDDAPIELAWTLTVHKSQGSEFDLVVLILPASLRRLSRELLYTALTRQKSRIVICHEGSLEELFDLTRATGSDTGQRLTDLINLPDPIAVTTSAGTSAGILDRNLVHTTDGGILVRSKNEVIIADILDDVAPGAWAYEQPLHGADGSKRLPDFTINAADGRTIFWEHLGMLENPEYAAAWDRKREWYSSEGILPVEDGGGPNGMLMWTNDLQGVDKPAWREHAQSVIGPMRTSSRKAGKKISSKHTKK